ncbi:hypothetical protein EJP02_535 [Escherichia phage EJP2]|nr:hypothetical protein EJP02_535 [Escherichia phage EJP2]
MNAIEITINAHVYDNVVLQTTMTANDSSTLRNTVISAVCAAVGDVALENAQHINQAFTMCKRDNSKHIIVEGVGGVEFNVYMKKVTA